MRSAEFEVRSATSRRRAKCSAECDPSPCSGRSSTGDARSLDSITYTTDLIILSLVLFAVAPVAIHLAPYESTMGLVQKIFYYHVPGAILMLLLAMFGGVTSAIYLFKKVEWADHWSIAAAEQVVLFGTMTLVTGPLWGRKAWGVYWDWDVRQTSALLLWLTFVSYLLLRRFGGPGLGQAGRGCRALWPGELAVRLRLGQLLAHAASEDDGDRQPGAADGGADVVLFRGVHGAVDRAVHAARATGTAAGEGRGPLPRRG